MTCQVIHKKIYSLDNSIESAAIVEPGEVFTVKLQNAFGESFNSEEEFVNFLSDDERKKKFNHPCTGPIEINTNEDNISLAIHILDTKATRGYQCVSKSTGFLKDKFKERNCTLMHFENDHRIKYGEDLIINTHPKIGFISTLDQQVRSPGRTSENGGNLDLNYLDKGSIIYLPVNDKRARIAIGDLHACQGNGEAAGIAIEADGEVTLRIDIVDKINFPIIRDSRRLIIVGWGESMDECLKRCVENAQIFFKRVFPFCNWHEAEIYKFLSAEGNLVLGNSTGKVVTAGMVFYQKRLLNKYDFPIFG